MSKIITQKLKFKQSVIKFSLKFSVAYAEKKFNVNRRTIYRWIKYYVVRKHIYESLYMVNSYVDGAYTTTMLYGCMLMNI